MVIYVRHCFTFFNNGPSNDMRLLLNALLFYLNSEEARSLLAASPVSGAWDPDVLDIYVSCGLTPFAAGVRLKTSSVQEALVFAHGRTSFEVWEAFEALDKRIELRWIVPGKGDDPG